MPTPPLADWEAKRAANNRNWDDRVAHHVGPKSTYTKEIAAVAVGLGRVVDLHCCASTSRRVRGESRRPVPHCF